MHVEIDVKTIGRRQGRSAVAAAAYRSGERLYNERQDKTHAYTRKQRALHSEVLAPAGAPDWARNREALWNGVEGAEKRKDESLLAAGGPHADFYHARRHHAAG
jgi:hypothetical protein